MSLVSVTRGELSVHCAHGRVPPILHMFDVVGIIDLHALKFIPTHTHTHAKITTPAFDHSDHAERAPLTGRNIYTNTARILAAR